jgi:hypothetical protein
MKLYGKTFTRREVEARLPRLETVGGVERVTVAGGSAAGVELVRVRTGGGLEYTVNASRCLDIGLAEFAGVPISWHSPAGEVHPSRYDARGAEWLRTAAGGLLMTCGLTQAGSPCEDAGESLGVHGRAHHTPARDVVAEGAWRADEYDLRVAGTVEEARLFGDALRLRREITGRLGENRITLKDTVENAGFKPSPVMLLYHFNFGFPLMGESTTVSFPSRRVVGREPGLPLEDAGEFPAPALDYSERVYYHEDLKTDSAGFAEAVIRNPRFPLPGACPESSRGGARPVAVTLRWQTANLPRLVQWKMPGIGVYALGLEPANCGVAGRAAERARGTLVTLAPGASLDFALELSVTAE